MSKYKHSTDGAWDYVYKGDKEIIEHKSSVAYNEDGENGSREFLKKAVELMNQEKGIDERIKDAFKAGWDKSAEGYNAEHPGDVDVDDLFEEWENPYWEHETENGYIVCTYWVKNTHSGCISIPEHTDNVTIRKLQEVIEQGINNKD